ncbi:hypothetical protein R3W88_029486 [Solanum pinnatisectum]|uniref:Uncharacterized protein n=1 Tax=Solanum pinnatisectum TaxID=50273 RepID=A0AAV9K5V1_9SOLN|nr:hypothetical protein R3W88_029486 [Solanum pinnatisectum]
MASSLCNSSSTFKVWFAIGATIIVVIWSFFRFEENPLIDRRYVEVIGIVGGGVGPESFAFDPHGDGPYTGVSDGRIIKWLQNETRWLNFALTSPKRYVSHLFCYLFQSFYEGSLIRHSVGE